MSSRATTLAALVIALLPTWFMLGGPPLTASSDGRYAAAAEQMARTDQWLVPRLGDRAHLTKPPLTYWAEAAAIEVFGPSEFAVRLPSALAMTVVVLGVFGLGTRLGGRRTGLIAAMLVGVMPLAVIVGRLTLTDGLLAPCWLGVLAGGWLAIREPGRWRGAALLWAAVAAGWMVKGPIVLIPLLPLIAWRGLAGRWGELGRLRPLIGLPLSLVPISAWAFVVGLTVPEAVDVWEHEVLGRAGGGGSHPEPWWYFLPVFIVGLFPATAMLPLPGVNLSWRRAWRTLRGGEDAALWALAILLPLIIFSLPSGKLATYITPLAPPAALLAAGVIRRWLDGTFDTADAAADPPIARPPDVRITLFIAALIAVAGGAVSAWRFAGASYALMLLPMVGVVVLAGWNWRRWSAGPAARRTTLTGLWLGGVVAWLWAMALFALMAQPYGARQLERLASRFAGDPPARLITFDKTHYALSFYARHHVRRVDSEAELAAAAEAHGRSLVVIAEADEWHEFIAAAPKLETRWRELATFSRWPRPGDWVIVVPAGAARTAHEQSPPRNRADR